MSSISAGTTSTTTLVHSGDTTGSLVFKTNDTGSGGTTAVTIDTSQNVGIGTSTPASKLQVSVSSGTLYQYITNTGTGDGGVRMQSSTTADYGIFADSVNALRFYDFKAVAERMRIDSSGNLLVGWTGGAYNDPGYNNKYGFALDTPSSVCAIKSCSSASNYWYLVGTGNIHTFVYKSAISSAGSTVGSISITASTTAYNTSSDYRLKNTIAPMSGALAKVQALKPVTYKWNADNSDGEGFIAHELAEVVPQCVTGEKDAVDADGNPVYQGIDTSFLVATLTAALQETKALIDQQAETINALTARVVALESK